MRRSSQRWSRQSPSARQSAAFSRVEALLVAAAHSSIRHILCTLISPRLHHIMRSFGHSFFSRASRPRERGRRARVFPPLRRTLAFRRGHLDRAPPSSHRQQLLTPNARLHQSHVSHSLSPFTSSADSIHSHTYIASSSWSPFSCSPRSLGASSASPVFEVVQIPCRRSRGCHSICVPPSCRLQPDVDERATRRVDTNDDHHSR